MKWAKTVRYQATISVDGEIFNIRLEKDFDEDFAVYINSEYIRDVENIPTREELEEMVGDTIELEKKAEDSLAWGLR